MKMAISFISGVVVCGLILFGVRAVIPTRAETDPPGGESENITLSLVKFIPDFEKIYRKSLIMPFEKAESKIYDKDIAEFYHELLDKTGLRESDNDTEK
jgi:hypothetical protein